MDQILCLTNLPPSISPLLVSYIRRLHFFFLTNTTLRIADASFIELPSGPAARELKRRWDLQIGVGKSVRSPYAITAFVNQHGKQMFRVGYASFQ